VRLHAALQQLRRATSSLPQPLRALLRVPRSYTFSSFFYAKLAPSPGVYCYQQVQRWTRPEASGTAECVLRYELLLFPINLSNTHWWVQGVLQAYLNLLVCT
jgi:Ulp1 family protease